MKSSSRKNHGFQNRILSIGGRTSETIELLVLREIVSRMREELDCLLRENIRLHVSDSCDTVSHVKAFRGELEDLIRHLILDARDAMPAGGELNILTGTVALDMDYARTHPEVPPGEYAMLTIRDTGDGSNAATRKTLDEEANIHKGRSLGLTACYNIIERLSGHLCVSRLAGETVIKIYLPCARTLHR
jgi:signal transduction histidine kinase